jgi:hypothetical protein
VRTVVVVTWTTADTETTIHIIWNPPVPRASILFVYSGGRIRNAIFSHRLWSVIEGLNKRDHNFCVRGMRFHICTYINIWCFPAGSMSTSRSQVRLSRWKFGCFYTWCVHAVENRIQKSLARLIHLLIHHPIHHHPSVVKTNPRDLRWSRTDHHRKACEVILAADSEEPYWPLMPASWWLRSSSWALI